MGVRWPAGYHRPAMSQRLAVPLRRPIARPRIQHYNKLVTVDLADDGIANPVTISAGGTATAQVGPFVAGETWSLDQCNVSTSVGPLDAALASVFIGPGAVSTLLVASSLAGGGSQFGLGGTVAQFGDFIIAQWTGGTPGSIAQLRVTGTKTAAII